MAIDSTDPLAHWNEKKEIESISGRFTDRLSHLETGKMNTGFESRRRFKDFTERGFVAYVDLVEDETRSSVVLTESDNFGNTIETNDTGVGKIVGHDNIVVLL
jgi:hypothetical protein